MRLLAPLALWAALAAAASAYADGGAVVASQRTQDMLITVFAAPVPLRAGPADLSVLVQDASGQETLLDADISLALFSADQVSPEIRAKADHAQATNRLFYAARVEISRSGPWRLEVAVRRAGHEAFLEVPLEVAAPLPPAARFWPWLAFPLLMVLAFLLHQWLRDRGTEVSS